MPNCIVETEQVHSPYRIYKMHKELQVYRKECNNGRHHSQNHFCTLITLRCEHLENLAACLPLVVESRHLTVGDLL